MKFPAKGIAQEEILALLDRKRSSDADWQGGKVFGYVYNAGDAITNFLKEVYNRFGMTNALSPLAFPSLRECESEVLAMTADLLNGPGAVGTITTGGTESICMAIKAARQWAVKERKIDQPEMVVPATAHPAFQKGAHYFGVKPVTLPVGEDFRVDPDTVRKAITPKTALVVGSAPNFPYGVIDPIQALAEIATDKGVLCHVDGCMGGFMLPFFERLGRPVTRFDFRVEGVTSISADLHKYGYTAKGASTVMYRNRDLRKHQFFVYPDWAGGLYASPSMTGARGGAPIAAAWATLGHLGEDGYTKLARDVAEATDRIVSAVNRIDGLSLLAQPDMSLVAFSSDQLDIYAVGEDMTEKGWHLDRLQNPKGLHMTVSPVHKQVLDPFLADLERSVRAVLESGRTADGEAAMYGALSAMDDRGQVEDFLLNFLDSVY